MKSFSGFFAAVLLLAFVSGCAGRSHLRKDVDTLKMQVGALATQMNRLAEETRYTQDAILSEEEKRKQIESDMESMQSKTGAKGGTSAAGVYRTPSGFEIKATTLQKALANAGYYDGPVDGKVGSQTVDAIRRFQSEHELNVDGVCGQQTWGKLKPYAEGLVK